MFKINNKKELNLLLKLIAEESVNKAKTVLKEEVKSYDPLVRDFEIKQNKSNDILGEQDEEESEEAAEPETESETKPESEKSGKPNPAAEKALSTGDYTDDYAASYDSIIDSINVLRAGRSLKDKEISQELRDYYDRLDENERAVLLLFLKELSKILTGALDGEDAQDPSDPKTYFNITKRDKEKEKPGDEINKVVSGDKERDAQRKDPEPASSDIEDTSPPIKVNESQDLSLLRKKIKMLMR